MQNAEQLNERREYKYLLPPHKVEQVRTVAHAICQADPYAGPDGLYTIRSLYFDTDDLHLFRANTREAVDRFKVRVRNYPATGPTGPIFFEVKQRVSDVIRKTRGMVKASQWKQLLEEPSSLFRLDIGAKYRTAVERFVTLVHTYQLRPVMLVEYDREAYFSTVDEYARMTFDLRIRCQTRDHLDLDAENALWRHIDNPIRTRTQHPMTLLELKFGGSPPRWMSRMVQNLELERYTFSKYGYSVLETYTSPELRMSRLPWEDLIDD